MSGNRCRGLHYVLTRTYLCSSAVKQGEVIHNQIVVGTPGTVLHWISKKALDLSKIVLFVLDEADIMVSPEGYQDQVTQILEWADLVLCSTHHAAQLTLPCFAHPSRTVGPHCQMALFSDTYNEDAMQFAQSIVSEPEILRLKKVEQLPENIKHFYVKCCNEKEKFHALANIFGAITIGQVIIFCGVSQHSDCGVCWY